MNSFVSKTAGFLSLTLHAHLPFVVNHGTWPHGLEWLLEAAAETYLPLLRVFRNLERDGIALRCNVNLSPILLEQLAHPVFKEEFPRYLQRKILAAREDEALFEATGEAGFADTARFWHSFFSSALQEYEAVDGDIIAGFRGFHQRGLIEIITSGATHGYLPLLGTDESVRAQVRTAVDAHIRHIGSAPRGLWSPECGYRPAGYWQYPVTSEQNPQLAEGFSRIGVEQAFGESGIEFFFVDTHLVEEDAGISSPYALPGRKPIARGGALQSSLDARKLYQPYFVDGPVLKRQAVTVFPRDPRTGIQVWSGDLGYPGDEAYLDFHKKRWPGGHRYWRVTGAHTGMEGKEPYDPARASERVKTHASHFVHLVWTALQEAINKGGPPPILSAPFDAELFGHWWFEGPQWLEAVARDLHDYPSGLELTNGSRYLDTFPRAGTIAMHEGSWGAEGNHQVWLNPETSWTYSQLYPAELYVREVCTAGLWRESATAERIVKQLCRELLLLESSDWQFLITTGAARDYAEHRFSTHFSQFEALRATWEAFSTSGDLTPDAEAALAAIEERDSIFADIRPEYWAAGAHDERVPHAHASAHPYA